MLSPQDVVRVKEYVFKGFPHLEAHVAVRSFDPPVLPELKTSLDLHDDGILDYIPVIRDDILGQIPLPHRSAAESRLDMVFNLSSHQYAKENALRATAYSLGPDAELIKYRTFFENEDEELYYITQFPSGKTALQLYQDFASSTQDVWLPENFKQIIGIFTLAHEFGHIIHASRDLKKNERISDVFGAACALSLEGQAARHSLHIINLARWYNEIRKPQTIHDTSKALKQALGAESGLRYDNLPAENVLDYALSLRPSL